MIIIEVAKVIELSKRFSTRQEWVKSIHCRNSYWTLKFCLHQFQWNEEMCSSPSPQSGCTSPHISTHSSMRHRGFFDIFDFMCRSTTGLQFKPKMKQLERWMQKLCYCKSWKTDLTAMECWTLPAAPGPSALSYLWTLTYPKIIFWKIILGPPCKK